MDFTGKNVVITGASSGIGRSTAIEFAKKGSNVILIARRQQKLLKVADELEKYGVSALACKCDVSDKNQVKRAHHSISERFGRIDVLVNNAGFAIYAPVARLEIKDIESQMATNYFGMVYCTKYFLPGMLENKSGHIINVASVGASFGLPGIASYCASKSAMLGFSEGLRYELKSSGIGVSVISPIIVRTGFFENMPFKKMPTPSFPSISPERVARAILGAVGSDRLEIIVPPAVRAAVWGKHTFPFIVNPIISSIFQKQLDAVTSD